MSETSVKRLSKVAKELNISIGSIVEFLGKKGFKIESNPNGKIGDEEYGHLLKEFHDYQIKSKKSYLLISFFYDISDTQKKSQSPNKIFNDSL